ncbi:thioredoxin family protein [Paenibacillus filicis]|uniref:Thioredoxin family protein n=1 Tax=Paenibacillus gyeongsangnamensis TaxID=3388067 RepID=A0ABT4QG88_9BACL|nr:thioredoxin family protein [Paenibacillus filicis]MCZ8515888.1 thioredoxin family protein [Paenibacillus filicis]
MPLQEWTQAEVLARTGEGAAAPEGTDSSGVWYLYFYTPFCGTCKVGLRMLEIISAIHPERCIGKINIHFAPKLTGWWQIESIPCLIKLERGIIRGKRYRLGGVDEVLSWMNGGSR